MLHTRSSTLITPGGRIKEIGSKKIGGYLVRFGDEDLTDLERQFFSKATDFGPHRKSITLYGPGLDPALKRRKLDEKAKLNVDDAGVWIETQLQIRDEYEELLYEEGILAGKMGWSSGTAAHLVEIEKTDSGAEHIKTWWLGLDASITPRPAEPRTLVTPLKQWSCPSIKSFLGQATKEESLNDRLRRISDDFRATFAGPSSMLWVAEIFSGYLIAEEQGRFYRVEYSRGAERFEFAPRSDWIEVVEDSQWIPRADVEPADTRFLTEDELAAAELAKQLKSLNQTIETHSPGAKLAASLASLNQRLETRHA